MRRWMQGIVGLSFMLGLLAPAMASPEGVWELETKDTQFTVSLCGDGTQLCGMLTWLSDADYNDQYLPYLNRSMADRMVQDAPNRWKGNMRLMGHRLSGTITQQSEDHMTLSGCAFLVVCKTYQMYRVAK